MELKYVPWHAKRVFHSLFFKVDDEKPYMCGKEVRLLLC